MSDTKVPPKSNQGVVKTARLSVPLPQKSAKELLEEKGKISVPVPTSLVVSTVVPTVATTTEEAHVQPGPAPADVVQTGQQISASASPAGSEIATQGKTEASSGSTSVSTPASPASRPVESLPSRPVSSISTSQAAPRGNTPSKDAAGKAPAQTASTASGSASSTKTNAPAANPLIMRKPVVNLTTKPMSSLADRVASIMEIDAGTPPPGLTGGSTNTLSSFGRFFHFMLYGEPNTYKTTTAAEFAGSERTLFIVTRRSEQLIPLARRGFKYVVTESAEHLRWALLHVDAAAKFAAKEANDPAWADRWIALQPDEKGEGGRVVIVDDVTEGTNVLKEDYMYVYNDKTGETTKIKDARQAYKKAGDELHDLLKITLGRAQHVGLIAVDTNFDVEGTIDNRTEPDLPNKMRKLFETELEYVFFFPHGDQMQTKTKRVVRSAQMEGKKEAVSWNEITFAKCKLPMEYLGKGVVKEMEKKDLKMVWGSIQAAIRGDWKPAQVGGVQVGQFSSGAGVVSSPKPGSSAPIAKGPVGPTVSRPTASPTLSTPPVSVSGSGSNVATKK